MVDFERFLDVRNLTSKWRPFYDLTTTSFFWRCETMIWRHNKIISATFLRCCGLDQNKTSFHCLFVDNDMTILPSVPDRYTNIISSAADTFNRQPRTNHCNSYSMRCIEKRRLHYKFAIIFIKNAYIDLDNIISDTNMVRYNWQSIQITSVTDTDGIPLPWYITNTVKSITTQYR